MDPGIAQTGWGILTLQPGRGGKAHECSVRHVDHGVITTRASVPLPARLLNIFTKVRGMLYGEDYLFAAVEEYMIGQNPNAKSAALVLQAKGAMLAACGAANIKVRAYTPGAIKKELTGKGNAKKDDVRFAVQALLGLDPIGTSHEADALATGVTAIRQMSQDDQRRLLKSSAALGVPT